MNFNQAINQHLTTNKNVKNVKELKNNTSNKNSMDEDAVMLAKIIYLELSGNTKTEE